MSTVPKLDLATLTKATANAVAIRRKARLLPADGDGKVYPPTYEGGKYALETRVVNGAEVPCATLDSVQSQANRMETALLEAHRAGKIRIPLVEIDFGAAQVPEVGKVSSLEAPHRLADALLRDSQINNVVFRKTEHGKVLDTATVKNASGLFGLCPTGLLFGLWDSAGPRGGLGTKFARAIVSEVTAIDVRIGSRGTSRIDPIGIQGSGPVFKTLDGTITMDKEKAAQEKGGAVKFGKEGKPSEANHGNVTPSLVNDKTKEPHHGGVTMDHAIQSVVISLPGIRRLRFPSADGTVTPQRDAAAQSALVALGLAAAALSIAQGCDLRSRCLLVPDHAHPAEWEYLDAEGRPHAFSLSADEACILLKEAVAAAKAAGLSWREEALVLTPSEGLVALVKKSRELAMHTSEEA